MENKEKRIHSGSISGESPKSKVDLISGEHTTTIVIGMLFALTLICFVTIFLVKDNLPDNVTTGLFSLLSLFAGFFAGSRINSQKIN